METPGQSWSHRLQNRNPLSAHEILHPPQSLPRGSWLNKKREGERKITPKNEMGRTKQQFNFLMRGGVLLVLFCPLCQFRALQSSRKAVQPPAAPQTNTPNSDFLFDFRILGRLASNEVDSIQQSTGMIGIHDDGLYGM
eukprot:scaffold4912_cov183-Ochromonas_danica.AAC.1